MGRRPEYTVLFDGVCNLCNAFVQFIIDRDPDGRFRFASLQSPYAKRTLEAFGLSPEAMNTFVLIENGRLYTHSTAALRVLGNLKGGWRLLKPLLLIPRPLRDPVYRLIARNRYKWFGQSESCRVMTPELADRFQEE